MSIYPSMAYFTVYEAGYHSSPWFWFLDNNMNRKLCWLLRLFPVFMWSSTSSKSMYYWSILTDKCNCCHFRVCITVSASVLMHLFWQRFQFYNHTNWKFITVFKDNIKETRFLLRSCRKRSKEKLCPPAPTIADPHGDAYSTVDECAGMFPRVCLDQSFASTPDTAAVGPKDGSMMMVECDLYSEPADALGAATRNALPDISPYACFYGAPKHQVLKVGWLDKLSPQGWVRFHCIFTCCKYSCPTQIRSLHDLSLWFSVQHSSGRGTA